MVFRHYSEVQNNFISITIRIWLLLLAHRSAREFNMCWGLQSSNETIHEFKKNELVKSKISDVLPRRPDINFEKESPLDNSACRYFKTSKRLICSGELDYGFLKTIKNEHITDFVIENYQAKSLFVKKYWSLGNSETGEWYMNMRQYQKLIGEIQLKDTGLQISVNVRIVPKRDLDDFFIDGEVFSNKAIKISWRLKGNLSLDLIRNRTVILLDIGAVEDSDWKLQSNLTFLRKTLTDETDCWKMTGIIKSGNASNQLIFYKGTVWTEMIREECKFLGKVKLQKLNLEASLSGNILRPQKNQISIPKSAFSDMRIQNFIFRKSNFYNAFDRNSFEGVRGLQRIAFIESRLESLPKLDELFQSLIDLEEIYVEDCIASRLKFGSLSSLKNVRKLSFRGSGPLNFDDTSFLWLKNSKLTFLDLRNSNVKISLKSDSVLWSVKHSLKNLDISCSTLNEEKDLNLILKNLKILSLKAEDLKLKKIPTSALANIRKTLIYLSFRKNDFRKNFEKHIFNSVLNFPIMLNLTELNLQECHINYIEKGTFDNLPNLKILHLSYNNLENVQDGWMFITPKITSLILNHNGIIPRVQDSGTSLNLRKFKNLEILDLSNGIFSNINKAISSLGNSLRNLSLQNTKLENLPENFFENLTGLEILNLSFNKNIKPVRPFSFLLFKKLRNLKSLYLGQCGISGISFFNQHFIEYWDSDNFTLENLHFIDLSGNNLKILDYKIFRAVPNLKILNLSENRLTEWSTMMPFNEHLDAIFLNENKIETIPEEMFTEIKRLRYVKLGNNPFVCGNYVYEVIKIINSASEIQPQHLLANADHFVKSDAGDLQKTDFIKRELYEMKKNEEIKSKKNLKFLDWSEKNYICFSWSQSKFLPFTEVNENFQDAFQKKKEGTQRILLWLTIVIVIGVVISIAIICWKFLDIHLITKAVRTAVALSFISRNDKGPTTFKYNVFLSYSEKDRLWVVENLLPRLESKSDVKVCLHERDFQVGLSIIENILNSIDNSRNIILVISQAFLKSQWCQYEMQLAQFRLLEKGRDQLILIFLENIPAIQRPKILKYLMMTKTYLEWPMNPNGAKDFDNFWNRLMKSLVNLN